MTWMVLVFLMLFESNHTRFSCEVNHPTINSIDTIYLNEKIVFNSDFSLLRKNCFPEFVEEAPLTKSRVISLQKRLNRELNTTRFNLLQVVTGERVKRPSDKYFITLMEWHFDSDRLTNLVFDALSKLKDNTIKHTLVPNELRYVKAKRKIYVITYSPFKKGVDTMDKILQCIANN